MIDLKIVQTIGLDTFEYIVPVEASMGLVQRYSNVGGHFFHRMMSGAGFAQKNWGKLRTTISGNGILPDALDGLVLEQPAQLYCIGRRSLESTSNAIALTSYRPEEIQGFARVAGRYLPSPVNVVGDVATVDAVAGATRYKVTYFPIMTVFFMDQPEKEADYHGSEYGFTLVAEEA